MIRGRLESDPGPSFRLIFSDEWHPSNLKKKQHFPHFTSSQIIQILIVTKGDALNLTFYLDFIEIVAYGL